jgi:two-component system cell cycle sensor histidine kinase/response regulator CckA
MSMTGPSKKNNTIAYLEKRVEYLENVERFIVDGLEMAASLGDFQNSINKFSDVSTLLEETIIRIQGLIPFKSIAFYLVDDENNDFIMKYIDSETYRLYIQNEVDYFIDNGTFAWALRENRPIIVLTRDGKELLLQVMATTNRVRGMCVALLPQDHQPLLNMSLSLLSTILLNSANAIESFELYRTIREINSNLGRIDNYRLLFAAAPDGVEILDALGNILDSNDSHAKLLKCPRKNLLGSHSSAYFSEHSRASFAKNYLLLQKNGFWEGEVELVTSKGEMVSVWRKEKAIYDKDQKFIGAVVYNRDITERKRTEEALRQSEATLRSVFKAAPVGLCIMKNRNFQSANKACYEIFGYSEADIVGHTTRMLYENEDEYERVGRDLYTSFSANGLASVQTSLRRKDGVFRDVIMTAGPLQMEDPSLGTVVAIEDITDRKQAEDSLKRSEHLYRVIFENAGDANLLLREDTKIILANSEFEKLSGYSKEEIEGKINWTEFIDEEDLTRMVQYNHLRRIDESAVPRKYEFRFRDRYGNARDIAISVDMIPSTKESIASLHDITERKQAERTLQESQHRMADIIEFFPDATLIIDKDGKIIAWNRAMEALTGVRKENMLGKGNYEYALPLYGERRPMLIDLVLNPDRETEKKYTAIHRVGDILFGEAFTPKLPHGDAHISATASALRDDKGEITAAIECVRDNTERKRLEEHLNRAEKMESLGTLAGGVAHDLNNVLGVLVGYSELIREELPVDSSLKKYADNLLQSSMKASAIIQDLLTLARRGVSVSKVVDLNRLVFDYLRSLEFTKLKSYHPNVKIWTELEDGLLNIKGSPIHLGKTIMNLVSNASESISDHGEITIKTANRYLDHPIRGYDTMEEGDYVLLLVSDTGIGISANDLGKIFEPFYTKKVMGRSGTGLGLAVVWGTVKDHSGYIDVRSEEGKGTTFTLYFPVTREEPAKFEKATSPIAYRSRGESILVVDDVKEQREMVMNMLGKLGYQVAAIAGGEEAVEYLKNKKADLIVLDMIMDPGIDGMETYRRILEINPGQKAVIVSGFSETDRVRNAQKMGAGAFVRKPYILEKIGLAVRKELDRK